MGPNDELSGQDPPAEEYQRHHRAIFTTLFDYMHKENLSQELIGYLLIEIAVRLRTGSYYVEAETPTSDGLRGDLDGFLHEFHELIEEVKQDADGVLARMKAADAGR
jgi:hypothetical protein